MRARVGIGVMLKFKVRFFRFSYDFARASG